MNSRLRNISQGGIRQSHRRKLRTIFTLWRLWQVKQQIKQFTSLIVVSLLIFGTTVEFNIRAQDTWRVNFSLIC